MILGWRRAKSTSTTIPTKLPREVEALRKALQADFIDKYRDVVTRLCYDICIPARPLAASLTENQRSMITSLTRKFSRTYDEVARALLGSSTQLADIVPFERHV